MEFGLFYYHSQEVELNEEAVLDALPFTNPGVTSLSFEWTKNSKMVADKSVLTVDKVTRDHCDGFYTCEVSMQEQLAALLQSTPLLEKYQ